MRPSLYASARRCVSQVLERVPFKAPPKGESSDGEGVAPVP